MGVGCCAVSAGAAGLLLDGDGRQSEVKGGFGPCVSLVVVIGADRLPLRRSLSDPLITRKRRVTTNRVSTQTGPFGDLADRFSLAVNASSSHERKSSILFSDALHRDARLFLPRADWMVMNVASYVAGPSFQILDFVVIHLWMEVAMALVSDDGSGSEKFWLRSRTVEVMARWSPSGSPQWCLASR